MKENLAYKAAPLPEENEVANDSKFGEAEVVDYVIPTTPTKTDRPFPLIDVNNIETIIVDEVLAELEPTPKRLDKSDFSKEAILMARLKAQGLSPTAYGYTEVIEADKEFAKHEILTIDDFSEEAILRARLIAQGKLLPGDTPSQRYTDLHQAGRINTNQEVPKATKPTSLSEEFNETKVAPKYNVTVHESVRATTPNEYERTGNLINPNATRLNRKDFPQGTPIYIPPRP
jgi:hypothetical protein